MMRGVAPSIEGSCLAPLPSSMRLAWVRVRVRVIRVRVIRVRVIRVEVIRVRVRVGSVRLASA